MKLTDRLLASGLTPSDLIHVVLVDDTSQDPNGSSYKATIQQLVSSLSGGSNTFVTGGTYTTGTATFTNTTGGTFNVTGFNTGDTTLYWYAENSTAPTVTPVATGSGSIALGDNAEALAGNMFVYGSYAGYGATSADYSNFIGQQAGYNAINSSNSNFFGIGAGYEANNTTYSNFIGDNAGFQVTNTDNSNFIGQQAGYSATGSSNSNFIGQQAGYSATGSSNSNFIGAYSGKYSKVDYANFIGYQTGSGVTSSHFSNLFGYNVGTSFTGNNIGFNNIIIGKNITLPNATTNAINIGGVLFGINTYTIATGNPSTGATATGKIGIGVVTPTESLDVAGAVKIGSSTYTNLTNGDTTPVPTGGAGTMVYDPVNNHFFGWNGSAWKQLDN